jgi:hypothetical protein
MDIKIKFIFKWINALDFYVLIPIFSKYAHNNFPLEGKAGGKYMQPHKETV